MGVGKYICLPISTSLCPLLNSTYCSIKELRPLSNDSTFCRMYRAVASGSWTQSKSGSQKNRWNVGGREKQQIQKIQPIEAETADGGSGVPIFCRLQAYQSSMRIQVPRRIPPELFAAHIQLLMLRVRPEQIASEAQRLDHPPKS